MCVLCVQGNTVFSMKHKEYCEQISEALKGNCYLREMRLGKCLLDGVDAKVLAG